MLIITVNTEGFVRIHLVKPCKLLEFSEMNPNVLAVFSYEMSTGLLGSKVREGGRGGGHTYQDSGLENGVFNIVSKNQLRYHVFNTDFYTILWTIQTQPKWLPYS